MTRREHTIHAPHRRPKERKIAGLSVAIACTALSLNSTNQPLLSIACMAGPKGQTRDYQETQTLAEISVACARAPAAAPADPSRMEPCPSQKKAFPTRLSQSLFRHQRRHRQLTAYLPRVPKLKASWRVAPAARAASVAASWAPRHRHCCCYWSSSSMPSAPPRSRSR